MKLSVGGRLAAKVHERTATLDEGRGGSDLVDYHRHWNRPRALELTEVAQVARVDGVRELSAQVGADNTVMSIRHAENHADILLLARKD